MQPTNPRPAIYTPKTQNVDLQLDAIAYELAYNYFTNSFGDKDVEKDAAKNSARNVFTNSIIQDRVMDELKSSKRVRNIMIVGAGASFDSYGSMPIGEHLTKEMNSLYKDTIEREDLKFLKSKYDEEENAIKLVTGNKDLTFENQLSLLSKLVLSQRELRNKIKEITGIRYAPSLFNEIAAHLLKHSFLDIIINYNFEETLDQAIEDEIGKPNYYEIISDGHCIKTEDITRDGRLTTPLYIKPHGTNSHKSTLRFTDNHYLELPIDIKDMLKTLLGGMLGNPDKNEKLDRVNLFVVGFALESFELNDIIKKCMEDGRPSYHIYHIDFAPFPADEKDQNTKKEKFEAFQKTYFPLIEIKTNKYPIYKLGDTEHHYIPVKTNPGENDNSSKTITSNLAEFFSVLWRKTHALFHDQFLPRSIARHEIMYYMLYDDILKEGAKEIDIEKRSSLRKELQNKFETMGMPGATNYFLDRALIEVSIAFTRNNGIIDLIELSKGKAGEYHSLYLKSFNKQEHLQYPATTPVSLYDLVLVFASVPNTPSFLKKTDNIYKIDSTEFKDLKNQGESTDIIDIVKNIIEAETDIVCPKRSISLAKFVLTELLTSIHLSERTKENICKNKNKAVYNGFYDSNERTYTPKKKLIDELLRLYIKSSLSHYYIINPRENDPIHNMFETFKCENLLHTNLSFKLKFRQLLSKDWDIALIITERGAMLELVKSIVLEKPDHFKNKHIILICSYDAVKSADENDKSNDWYERVKGNMCGKELSPDKLTILFAPSREHNHHMSVFLKKGEDPEAILLAGGTVSEHFSFQPLDALYHFRQSFSNSIDPVIIKNKETGQLPYDLKTEIASDYGKLIKIFHLLLIRSFDFTYNLEKKQPENDKLPHVFGETSLLHSYFKAFKDSKDNNYKTWSIERYNEEVIKFLSSIYKSLN